MDLKLLEKINPCSNCIDMTGWIQSVDCNGCCAAIVCKGEIFDVPVCNCFLFGKLSVALGVEGCDNSQLPAEP